MTTLVVYRQDNLANPARLLTHFDDIQAELARAAIPLQRIALEPLPESLDSIEELPVRMRRSLQSLQADGDWGHAELYSLPAIPRYAASVQSEPEHTHPDAGMRWFVRGGGVLCLNLADQLLVLGCDAGDTLIIPAATRHWFRPRPGEPVQCLRLAQSQAKLAKLPTGSGIDADLVLPDL